MEQAYNKVIKQIYNRFNARDIDGVLRFMDPDVHWPNGWEGGFVHGHEEIRSYWTRQWKEIDSFVEPITVDKNQENQVVVNVHQVAKDLNGKVLFDGTVTHIYTFNNGLIKSMEIEKA